MKYQITCGHCNKRFLVDGKGGQTIECTCPGCGGTMRVVLPKIDKADADEANATAADDVQRGYAPQDNNPDNGQGDDGKGGHRRRGLALGCLIFVVVIAAAVVAFMALNHTTKKPIEDPYEYMEPDTATVDSVPEDTEEVVVDTVQVHKEEPKVEAQPIDTTMEVAEPESGDGSDAAAPADDNSDNTAKPADKSHHSSASESSTKDSKKDKSSKKTDASSTSTAKE